MLLDNRGFLDGEGDGDGGGDFNLDDAGSGESSTKDEDGGDGDGGGKTKPSEDGGKGSEGEATQKDLDWRKDLPDELKTNETLQKFKTKKDLAESYITLEKKLGSGIPNLTKDSPLDDVGKTLSKMLDIKEDSYDKELPEGVKKAALSSGVHPKALTKVVDTYKKETEKTQKTQHITQEKAWKDELVKGKDKAEFEKNVNFGLKTMKLSFSEYKEIFGKNSFNPRVMSYVEGLGKKGRGEHIVKIQEGKSTGDLPSDGKELMAMFDRLTTQIGNLRAKSEFLKAEELEQKQLKVQHKIAAIRSKPPKSMF